jgi:serine/threonine protein phosphatase PrpC
VRDEVLQRVVGERIAQPSMHRLHGRALAVVEQSVEILRRRVALGSTGEAVAELVRELSEPLSKARLGSGEVEPTLVRHQMAPHDILLILTDGAWTPLGPVRLERAARKAALAHLSDVPPAVLEAAAQRGRADDMTSVAIRLASH